MIKYFIEAFIEVYSEICVIAGFIGLIALLTVLLLNKLESIEKKKKLEELKRKKYHEKLINEWRNGGVDKEL